MQGRRGWIKGIFAVRECGIREMIAVTEGDCSYTKVLTEFLSKEGKVGSLFILPAGTPPSAKREYRHVE